jgi:predicted secreted hydrolase
MNKQQLQLDPTTGYTIVPWMSFVDPQADLATHGDKYPLESWFVVANLTSGDQKLGFQIHVLVMNVGVGEPVVSLNTSFVNQTTGFYRDQEYVYPLSAITISSDNLDIRTPDFILKGDLDQIQVRGSIPGVSVDVTVKRTMAVLYACGTGHFQWIDVEQFDYALPHMETEGTIEIEGESFAVSGPSWLDRQYGMLPGFFRDGAPKDSMKWIWMNLQLSNGEYFSLTEITQFHEKRLNIFTTGINDEGALFLAGMNPIEKLDYWKSPVTGRNYPTRFKIQIPSLDASFEVNCTPKEQEIVSKLGGVNKYEGAADVTGTYRGEPVTGVTYVEMVGYWD